MIALSTNAKEAIKIALAITIAYYIGMRMAWMNPTWAAISVAMISLPTAGQSLNKGALRMGGTLIAVVVGLLYLGLFPQDRWLFLAALTPYLAFVTYRMTGENGQYLWFVAAFVSMMIVSSQQASSEGAFQFAVYRGLETLMGITVWTLVSVFVWPQSNRTALATVSRQLLEAEGKLVGNLRSSMIGPDTGEAMQPLRDAAAKLEGALRQTIGASASESYDVREVRHLWDRLHASSLSAIETLDRLHSDAGDLRQIDLQAALPELRALLEAAESRLQRAARELGGQAPAGASEAIELTPRQAATASLDHFHRAALKVAVDQLERLEMLSRDILECVREIRRPGARVPAAAPSRPAARITGPFGLPALDPDRVRATIMVVASMWVASLIYIYVNPPGHASWYQFVPNLALVAVQTPQMRFTLLKPMTYAYLVGLSVYVFVLPQLSVFWQLGLVIFAFTWVAAYFFSGIGRIALYLAMFNMLGIQNEQTYDFAKQANTLLFTVLALALVVALTYIMRSPRQEKAFVSMVRRFLRSSGFLIAWAADPTRVGSIVEQAKRAYHLQELRSLPRKLGTWGAQLNHRRFPHNSPERVEALVGSVQLLAYRVEDLIEARRAPQAASLVRELRDDVRAWRIVMEQNCERASERPDALLAGELREGLATRLDALNVRVEATLNAAGDAELSDDESTNFYRLLGSLRGLSEAAILYARRANDIDWDRWREERFS